VRVVGWLGFAAALWLAWLRAAGTARDSGCGLPVTPADCGIGARSQAWRWDLT